jgi:RNA polymerase sigma-70 factor (ECF subfamily)
MDLDTLIGRFRGPLVGLLHGWGASPRDAVELAQDTFAEAYLSRGRFLGSWEDPASVGPWLRGIARRLFLAHGRRLAPVDGVTAREVGREEASPEPVEDGGAELRALVAGLPEEWRTVLHLRYVEDCGLAEIAGLLGISERAVEGRLHRARRELKERLLAASEDERAMAPGGRA